MDDTQRQKLEADADRAIRRGDLRAALERYQALCEAFPFESALVEKKQQIEESLQPSELLSAKSRTTPSEGLPVGGDPELARAEALADRNQLGEAILIYRKALEARPDSPLLKERLDELFQRAQVQAPRPSPTLPASKDSRLKELLLRVGTRKRVIP